MAAPARWSSGYVAGASMNRAQLNALIDRHPGTIAEKIEAADTAGAPAPNAIVIGTSDAGQPVVLDLPKLVAGRLLIQGNSGAGKSMLLRRIFEQAFGRIQQLVIDGEGEFSTLAPVFDVAVVTAADVLRVGPEALAQHIRAHRYSAVLDLSDATAEERLDIVAKLAKGLVDAPEEHWHPMLVLIDEAQVLAPFYDNGDATPDTRKASIVAISELMGRGRKRGLTGVIATARLAETSKAVVSKATNVIVGRTIFDRDVERAGSLLGFTAARAAALRALGDGEFLAIGPAIAGPKRVRFRSGPVQSEHKGRAPDIVAPPSIGAAAAAALLQQVPDAPISPDEKAGRSRGWTAEDDAVIRDGYERNLKLADLAALLIETTGTKRSLGAISGRAQYLGLTSVRAVSDWSDDEYQIVIDAYEAGTSIAGIRDALTAGGYDRSFGAIQMAAIKLGISGKRVNLWTEEETAIALNSLAAGRSHAETLIDLKAAGFIRGPTAIHKFATKHGVLRKHDPWTDEQVDRLRVLYEAKTPVRDIASELGKEIAAVRTKASLLGFKQRVAWSDEDYRILTEGHAAGERLTDVAEKIGRPYANVARVAATLKLSFQRAPSTMTGRN